ncbi:MAG: hypothetical protein JWR04_1493 [Rhodoglobus sp.]|nr:hypothetical protein [Rhodoglobus sp.]
MADPHDDDAALAWAGDEKPVAAASAKPVVEPPSRVELVETSPTGKPQMPAALLITYGILAGACLIYTIGWVVSVQRYNATVVTSPEPLNAFMFGLGEILAMLAPALWFVASLLLTRGRKPVIRLLALLIGLVIVLPWPFVLGVWQ